jgi:hypothetical protein
MGFPATLPLRHKHRVARPPCCVMVSAWIGNNYRRSPSSEPPPPPWRGGSGASAAGEPAPAGARRLAAPARRNRSPSARAKANDDPWYLRRDRGDSPTSDPAASARRSVPPRARDSRERRPTAECWRPGHRALLLIYVIIMRNRHYQCQSPDNSPQTPSCAAGAFGLP